jgi:hypothetical protein
MILADTAQVPTDVQPRCIAPGGHGVLDRNGGTNAATKVTLYGIPQAYDPKTGTIVQDVQRSDWVVLGTFPLAKQPAGTPGFTDSVLHAEFTTPAQTAFKGAPIDTWNVVAEGTDDAGTNYGTANQFGGSWDASTKFFVVTPRKTVKGTQINLKVFGYEDAKVTATFKKGKTKKTVKVPSSSDPNTTGLPCGYGFTFAKTSSWKKGTYKVTVGGKKAGKVKLT